MQLVSTPALHPTGDSRRWATLVIVCFAQLMIVLDVTIVNVALPAIQDDLSFDQSNLTWVVGLLRPRDPQLADDSIDRIPARLTLEEAA